MYIIVYKIRAYSCSLNYVVAAFFKDVQFLGFFQFLLLQVNLNSAQRVLVFI